MSGFVRGVAIQLSSLGTAKMRRRMKMKCFVSLIVSACVFATGCGSKKRETISAVVATETQPPAEDIVKIDEIIAPKYDDTLAIMFAGGTALEVDWGNSSKNSVMVSESGYPGFGKPMLVLVNGADGTDLESTVTLETGYGQFTYLFQRKQDAVWDSDSRNVISKSTRDKIINFYDIIEKLFIFSLSDGQCFEYSFSGGTKITV